MSGGFGMDRREFRVRRNEFRMRMRRREFGMRRHGRERVHVRVAVAAAVSLCGRDGQLSVAGSRLPEIMKSVIVCFWDKTLLNITCTDSEAAGGTARVAAGPPAACGAPRPAGRCPRSSPGGCGRWKHSEKKEK